ncbi:cilium assembly protein DZIP1L [Astyanax mexicanus]|uniref:cilium assembly protein DZIP1L n=1 Tax=Astyanax mexicanus TaxID=7994 RepID=UPI0020CB5EC2|nr:cilium assembly protein DZIP1L [Astyanax mexicanus]XP_049335277.1 cilium assembly protein DZIP1L [Astyanax mexicanus]
MPGQFSPAEPRSPLVTPLSWSTGPPALPFHFRSRTEPMDWRRLSALDVDRVAREMDINVLQEFITAVTFCDAESERCPHCRGATDPTLLKVLRMSQLSTEYLLHCQDYLSTQVSALEERLHGALSQNQRDTEEQARLEKELQEVKLESRRRKKMISTQQLLLQASANNYHKCQFCEKSFVNYSYLQSHIQRRHPEITDAERQKKKQVEQMEDGIEELKEKLRLTQLKLAAEKEADAHQRQQEQEEQRRRETAEKEAMERWKEEERKKFQQEIQELRQLFLQEFKGMANRSFSIENKLQELESREQSGSPVRGEDEVESERRLVKEKQLKEHMAQKRNEWRKKVKELQNLHQQEKEELQSENVRLQRALTVEHSSSSSLQNLKQQLLSLSSQIKQKDRLIRSHEQKIKKLSARPLSGPPTNVVPKAQNSSVEEEDDDNEEEEEERLEDSMEAQRKVLESLRGNSELMKEFRPILEETLEERLEKMGLRKGTKGISKQTLKSLSSVVSAQRLQRTRSQVHLQDLRENLVLELNTRMKDLQKNQNIKSSATHTQQRKKPHSPVMERGSKTRQNSSKHSHQKTSTLQPPIPAPRGKTPAHTPTAAAHTPKKKKSGTPPFSSEEDESAEDSAYITSSRGKPSPSTHITPPADQHKPSTELDWSDSDTSEESDQPKGLQAYGTHGSVVQTLTRSLEKQLSSPVTKPAGGVQMFPPATLPSRPSITKQQAVSEEESDLDLSSIEDLTALPTGPHRSSDMGGTSGTSVWSSAASRARVW